MEIFLCRGYSGQIFRINANEQIPLNILTPVMANSIGLYSSNEERLGVYNLTKDFGYGDADTLASRATGDGDLLILADGGACHKRTDGGWEGMGHDDEHHHDHTHDAHYL